MRHCFPSQFGRNREPRVTRSSLSSIVLLGISGLWLSNDVHAEDPPVLSAASQDVLKLLEGYRVQSIPENPATDVRLVRRPLLTFGDAARNNEGGTLWVWMAAERPVAFVENYLPVGDNSNWVQALTLSSPTLIEMEIQDLQHWKPTRPQRVMHHCPDDLRTVAATPGQRLRQMKEISRRFQAHEYWDPDNSRFELRLLVQPILRYGAESTQTVDAAVFVFAHGTNPEVLLHIEASREADATVWKYGLIRLGSAEMHVACDEREVWTVPRTPGVVGQPTDPYWLCVLPNPARAKN